MDPNTRKYFVKNASDSRSQKARADLIGRRPRTNADRTLTHGPKPRCYPDVPGSPSVEKHKAFLLDQFLGDAIAQRGEDAGRAYVASIKGHLDAELVALTYALLTDDEFDRVIANGGTPAIDL